MTWSAPDPAHRPDDAAAAWARGGSTLFPRGKLADRISTVLLLVFGALLTVVTAIVAVVAIASATASCDAAAGCTPGGWFGGAAIAVGGAFVIGVATVVLSVGAWVRRRTSWWIAAVGFVLAIVCITVGTVMFVDASDDAAATGSSSSVA
jgi:uncharacterized BrkB/YihY/UPF0761 family membrane protein